MPQGLVLVMVGLVVAVQLAEGQPTRLPITLTNGPVELLLP